MSEKSDADLLALFFQEDSKHLAFNTLVKRYQEMVYYYCRKVVLNHDDANDATQDVFILVWQKLAQFKGESKLSTWLYTIATNCSIQLLRKKKKHLFQSIDDVQHTLVSELDNGIHYSGDAIRKKLDTAVLQLPHKQRIVFILKYFEEKSFAEIHEITKTSIGALKASYHHAVTKIQKMVVLD